MKEIIKKMVSAVMMVTLILAVAGCGNGSAQKEAPQQAPAAAAPKQGSRTLVVYFSATGNTQKVAETIAKETGADPSALNLRNRTRRQISTTTTSRAAS